MGATSDPGSPAPDLDDIGPVSRFVRELPNPIIKFDRCHCGGHHFFLFVPLPGNPNVYAKIEPFPYDLSRGPA